jgi:hypothetical protein
MEKHEMLQSSRLSPDIRLALTRTARKASGKACQCRFIKFVVKAFWIASTTRRGRAARFGTGPEQTIDESVKVIRAHNHRRRHLLKSG